MQVIMVATVYIAWCNNVYVVIKVIHLLCFMLEVIVEYIRYILFVSACVYVCTMCEHVYMHICAHGL